jgi:hypothetical protein
MNTIRLFMWGYQGHFHASVEVKLESLLKKLGITSKPQVFIVGKQIMPDPNHYEVCVEPETELWNEVSFKNLAKIESEILEKHELNQLIQSHPIAQKNQDEGMRRQSFLRAVQRIVNEIPTSSGKLTFLTSPVKVGNYFVTVVLQINESDLLPPNSLTKNQYEINEFRNYRLSRSLIDVAVFSLLNEIVTALRREEPGASLSEFERSDAEILRNAGDHFLQEIELRSLGMHFRGDLFSLLNSISSLKYEGSDVEGAAIIARNDHPNLKLEIKLTPPINLNDARRIRKLMQISFDDLKLIISSEGVIGYGKIEGDYNDASEDLFEIGFRKNNTWDLFHNGSLLMRTVLGQPEIPKRPINEKKLRIDLPRIFTGINAEQVDKLFEIIKSATRQKHGTLLIISDNAKAESERLKQEAVSMVPLGLTDKIVQRISEIDGSLIVDRDGICYSFGTILDGISEEGRGDPSRGSRYNSAIRYVESQKKDGKYTCVAIIVSSDGMVDLYPNLRPQIERSRIDAALTLLSRASNDATPSNSDYSQLMNFFDNIKFYLSQEDCDTVNNMREVIYEKLRSNAQVGEIFIVHNELTPNSEMNGSYYF